MKILYTEKIMKDQTQHIIMGLKGKYAVRNYGKEAHSRWWAIQLFGAVGCIAGEGSTPEEAVIMADKHFVVDKWERKRSWV